MSSPKRRLSSLIPDYTARYVIFAANRNRTSRRDPTSSTTASCCSGWAGPLQTGLQSHKDFDCSFLLIEFSLKL